MDYIKIIITSFFSLVALFILTKLIGNRQVSEFTMLDYVMGITIGSIAAEMATELEEPLKPLVSMITFAIVSVLISFITSKSMKIRKMIFGKPIILMKDGKAYRKNFKKSNIDLSEFFMQCRAAGYFDISAINTAILEPSGKISFFPFSHKRPLTAEDLKVVPSKDTICHCIVEDGVVLKKNLKNAGKDELWFKGELKALGIKDKEQIFFATVDEMGHLTVFENTDRCCGNPFE